MSRIRIIMDALHAADAIVRAADASAALIYAFGVYKGGVFALDEAAERLKLAPEAAEKGKNLLVLYGVAQEGMEAPAREEASFTFEELGALRKTDPAFRGLCDYYEKTKGTGITRTEMETLCNVYQTLNLPAEVLMLAINSCSERGRVSIRAVEKTAYRWFDDGICTYDCAEAHLRRLAECRRFSRQLLRMFGITDRAPSPTEEKYAEQWEKMDLPDSLIKLAYDRTVTRTGRLEWKYMNTILESWHKEGVKTPAQVDELDRKPRDAAPSTRSGSGGTSAIAVVTAQFEAKRKKREQTAARRLADLRARSLGFAENEKELRLISSKMARASGSEKQELEQKHKSLIAGRDEILHALGKDRAWLDPQPDCIFCNDMGYIGANMCTCFKEAIKSEEQSRHTQVAPSL